MKLPINYSLTNQVCVSILRRGSKWLLYSNASQMVKTCSCPRGLRGFLYVQMSSFLIRLLGSRIIKKSKTQLNNKLRNRLSKLATVVEGDPKAPFSVAATHMCRGGRYSFFSIAPLYPWYLPWVLSKEVSSNIF